MPKFIYSPGRVPWADEVTHTQTFRCQSCGDTIHVDTDWTDEGGGFIGSVHTKSMKSVQGDKMKNYTMAKIYYDAYCKAAGGVSLISGDKLPEFHNLKQEIQDAWAAVDDALFAEYRRRE
jgi:hypothetical protein